MSIILALFQSLQIALIALLIIVCMLSNKYSSAPPQTLMRKTTLLLNIPLAIAKRWEKVVTLLICLSALSLVLRDLSNDLSLSWIYSLNFKFSCTWRPSRRSTDELFCWTSPSVTVRLGLLSLLYWLVVSNIVWVLPSYRIHKLNKVFVFGNYLPGLHIVEIGPQSEIETLDRNETAPSIWP